MNKINERLLCAIKGFLTENTIFPAQFNFKGEDLLANLLQQQPECEE
jgi:hypothetical protein